MENKYTFHEKGHRHLLNGKPLTGITTVLNVISKPFLIPWAVNMAVEYIDKTLNEEIEKQSNETDLLEWLMENWKRILKEAKVAHTKKKEDAGQKGTDVHAICEGIIKEAIEQQGGIIHPIHKSENTDNPQVLHFLNWAEENKVKFLASELHLYSVEHFLGGIMDFVCEIDGNVWIGDIKTGSGIYAEAFFQCAGYQIMLEEMGLYPNIKGHIILNLKKDGSFNEKRSISNEDNKQAFLSALSLYRIKAKVEGNLI